MTRRAADTPRPSRPEGLTRRTFLHGTAWGIPAISAVTVTPAFAASGDDLSITQVPDETVACHRTTGPVVARLAASQKAGQLVQFSLPAGWTWTTGSGGYLTDAQGYATVPAGDIIVGDRSASLTATAAGLTATAGMVVTSTGSFVASPLDAPPSQANSTVERVAMCVEGAVISRANGELWSYESYYGPWKQVGTGASTGPGQLAYAWSARKALWIKNGALQFGTSAAGLPSGANSDFVRVEASDSIAVAVKSTGDLWGWSQNGGWSLLATGVLTGTNQIACLSGQVRTVRLWIADGVLTSDSGAEAIGTDNSGFVRVVSTSGYAYRNGTYRGGAVCAVRANGDIWFWVGNQGWTQLGTGAMTDAGQSAVYVGSSDYGVFWIKNGVLYRNQLVADMPSASNSSFVRVAAKDGGGIGIRDNGEVWTYNGSFSKDSHLAATGISQSTTYGSGAPNVIVPASC